MKYLKLSAFLFPMVLLFACQESPNRDCSEIYCFSPPPQYNFQLIDKESGKDLVTLKDLSIYDLKLYNISLDKYESIHIDSANGINFIETLIGRNEGVTVYEMKVEDEPVFEIIGNFEKVYENCCGFTRVHDFSIENATYEYDTATYSYKVFVAY